MPKWLCTAEMTDLIRRLAILCLVFLLLMGAAQDLLLSANSVLHVAQEANCPIHSGIAQPERAQLLIQLPVITIGEMHDSTHAFHLSAKISHPPTI